ncbi:MAG: hypothetical protein FJY67_08180, partial [Calditrichaeota bacterium]|nr:hypothetical protein [Calditrichota bacterium]
MLTHHLHLQIKAAFVSRATRAALVAAAVAASQPLAANGIAPIESFAPVVKGYSHSGATLHLSIPDETATQLLQSGDRGLVSPGLWDGSTLTRSRFVIVPPGMAARLDRVVVYRAERHPAEDVALDPTLLPESGEPVHIGETGVVRGIRIAPVIFDLAQFDASQGEVITLCEVEAALRFEPDAGSDISLPS